MTRKILINGQWYHIGKSTKSVSVRLPEDLYDIVMNCKGKNFSDKLVRLIFEYQFLTDSH